MKLAIRMTQAFYRRIWLYTLAFAMIFVIAAQEVPDFSSLEEFFVWLGTGGGSMLVAGLVVAYLLENFTWWHNLPRLVKLIVPIVLAGVFAVVAQSVIVADLLSYIPATMQTVLLMLIGWLFSQLGYKSIKASGANGYGKSARPADG